MSSRPRYLCEEFDAYLRSATFRSRSQTVQREYARIIDHLHQEIGSVESLAVRREHVRQWRDAWAPSGHRAATMKLQVLRNALEPLLSDNLLPRDLFLKQLRVARPHGLPEQNGIWREEEVEAVLDHCLYVAPGLARAIGLARYAGLRRQTICSILETARCEIVHGDIVERRLVFRSAKSEQDVDILEDPRLTELLDGQTCSAAETICYNRRNRPWAPRQLNQALDRVVAKLAALRQVRSNLTLHGLRHTRGVELAHAGASDAHLAAQLGHADEQTAREYRRQAARRSLADHAQRLVDAERQRTAGRSAGF